MIFVMKKDIDFFKGEISSATIFSLKHVGKYKIQNLF